MPFDRMVGLVDEWAFERGRSDVYGQIGESDYKPKKMIVEGFLSPSKFRERISMASAVVAHAGIGTIITALELGTPIIVFPRRASEGETRNDHQVATAQRFAQQGQVVASYNRDSLFASLDAILNASSPAPSISSTASDQLVERLRTFVLERGNR